MKRIAMFLGATAIVLMAVACNESADTHDVDVKAIKNIEIQWNQDYAAKDADKITAHYATDAVLMVPGMPAISGKDAIRASMQQMVADPALSLTFQATKVDVAKSGDLAYTQGSYSITVTDAATKKVTSGHGSYVTVYRKLADGTWRAVSDIATSDAPPAAPAAAKGAKGKRHAEAKKHASVKKHHGR
jgi:uncharacterized protein (TIGR02246 family)